MTDLSTLTGGWGSESEAHGINDSGQIVGWSTTASGGSDACLWQNGQMQDLGPLPGDSGSCALGINDSGQVVGFSISANGTHQAVIWQPVPEPSSILALLCGIGGLGTLLRKRSA